MRRTASFSIFVWLLAFVALPSRADPSPDVLAIPPRDSFLLLPLHIHILSSPDRDDVDCKLTDDDVRRVVGKVNGVWHKAGIHFCLEPILREKAANVGAFAASLAGPDADPHPAA